MPALSGVRGLRAVIDFVPKPTSSERMVAGVVTRLDSGEVSFTCAIDKRKMEHAFGNAGAAFYSIALKLCESLAEHWQVDERAEAWQPPFENARLAGISRFSGRSAAEAQQLMLNRNSSLNTLLAEYEMSYVRRPTGIVERVRSAVKRDRNATHLARRFNRELLLGGDAPPMRVDFLGQHYACYFLQITRAARGLESNTERAFGKLYELQALQRFVKKPTKNLGLLADERPDKFELVMVGERSDAVQRRAIYHVEALADKGKVNACILPTAAAAADHVYQWERMAA